MNKRSIIIVTLALLPIVAYALSTREQAIESRIQPVGQVNTDAPKPAVVAAAGGGPANPETTYNTYCTACHTSGAAGAPVLGNKEAWAPRVALGVDQLTQVVIKGLGAMPPRGMCSTCSDADLKAVVEFMVNKSK